jgi:hypothetical protein
VRYLLNSTLLVRGVRVSVSLAISDADYERLTVSPPEGTEIIKSLAHDLGQLIWKEHRDATTAAQ